MAPRIYTVGSSTRAAAEFLEVLAAFGVRTVADVRRFPASSRYPHFTREVLAASSATAILCAERLPWRCHRRFLASALRLRGWEVVHIVERERRPP